MLKKSRKSLKTGLDRALRPAGSGKTYQLRLAEDPEPVIIWRC
jgi:hypothetical protein